MNGGPSTIGCYPWSSPHKLKNFSSFDLLPFPTVFSNTTLASIIKDFLYTLSTTTNTFHIIPEVIAFTHSANKKFQIRHALPEDKADYEECQTLLALKDTIKSAGTLMFFTANIQPAVQQAGK